MNDISYTEFLEYCVENGYTGSIEDIQEAYNDLVYESNNTNNYTNLLEFFVENGIFLDNEQLNALQEKSSAWNRYIDFADKRHQDNINNFNKATDDVHQYERYNNGKQSDALNIRRHNLYNKLDKESHFNNDPKEDHVFSVKTNRDYATELHKYRADSPYIMKKKGFSGEPARIRRVVHNQREKYKDHGYDTIGNKKPGSVMDLYNKKKNK